MPGPWSEKRMVLPPSSTDTTISVNRAWMKFSATCRMMENGMVPPAVFAALYTEVASAVMNSRVLSGSISMICGELSRSSYTAMRAVESTKSSSAPAAMLLVPCSSIFPARRDFKEHTV